MLERDRFQKSQGTGRLGGDHLYMGTSIRMTKTMKPVLIGFLLVLFFLIACSNLTGVRIPGTEKSAVPTTTVYLVLENVETIPENLRAKGEIFVDNAFFGNTERPGYYRFVGNALVIGKVQIEKEKVHTIKVEFPGYEKFEHTRYFGTLPEYSISFRLIQLTAEPETVPEE